MSTLNRWNPFNKREGQDQNTLTNEGNGVIIVTDVWHQHLELAVICICSAFTRE
jgi:hypothetical protein